MGIACPRMIIAYCARWGVHIHQDVRILIVLALLGLTAPTLCLAANPGNLDNRLPTNSTANIKLTVSQNPQPLIHLEAWQAPLGEILKQIANKTGVLIHYSVLPEAPVTATCVGATASQIMDCLVAKQVGLVAHNATKAKPAEFWLLGSSVGSCQAVTVAAVPLPITPVEAPHQATADEQAQADHAMQEQSDRLVDQAHSKDSTIRAEAISNLVSSGVKDDPNVRKVLDEALRDQDAGIRTQALAALAQREGENAGEVLRQALNDKDAGVRLAAVDHADNDRVLLELALADKDAGVRDFANAKLAALNKKEGN